MGDNPEQGKKLITVYIDIEDIGRMKQLANKEAIPMSIVVRRAIKEYLRNYEQTQQI